MKKIILLFTVMMAVAGVQAYDKNIDLSNPTTNNATWNASTNVLSFTSEGYAEFEVQNVDTYTSVDVIVTANSGSFRIALYSADSWYAFGASSKETSGTAFGASNTKTFSTNVVSAIGSITKIRISLATSESGSVTIPSICFKGLAVNSNTEGFSGLAYTGTQTNLLAKTFPVVINQSGFNFLLGNTTAKDGTSHYLDVTDYDALYFEVTNWKSAVQLRANVGTTTSSTLYYAHKIGDEVSDWTTNPNNNIDANGWYYFDLSGVTALRAVSTQSLGQASERFTVNKMYLVKSTFKMTDGKDAVDIMYDPIGATVAYDRTFTVDQKSTVCLPFALTEDEVTAAGTFYELTSVSDGTLHFTEVTTTEAYKPYLFKAKTATPFASLTNKAIVASSGATTSYTVGDYTFTGTLAHQAVADGAYGWNSTSGAFSKATTDAVTIDAFRAYITSTSPARSLNVVFDDGVTTGIRTINREPLTVNQTYNLAGQRVGEGHKGLVIKNGKKYFVK